MQSAAIGGTGTNDLVFYSNGLAEGMRLTSGGNLGIGTTTPGAKLDVFKGDPGIGSVAANAFSTAVFSNSTHNYLTILSPNNRTGVVAFGDPQDAVKGQIGYDHSADQLFMTINGTGNTAVYTNSGNFGIGTTSPQSRLHLNTSASSQYIQLTADAAGSLATDGLQIGILNSGVDASLWNLENGYMRFATNNTERVRITSTGNVGIGTTTPTSKLTVYDDSQDQIRIGSNSISTLLFSDTGGTPQDYRIGLGADLATFNKFGIYDKTDSRMDMIFDGTGNVGIGTSNPAAKLDISAPNVVTAATTYGNLNVYTNNAQAIDTGGSITLGGFRNDGATELYAFGSLEGRKENGATGSSSGYLLFKTTSAGVLGEKMRINSSGNLGIGNTVPASKLHITGSNVTDASFNAGNVFITSSDALAADMGGSLSFGGVYNGSGTTHYASVAGRKTNATSGNTAGYLSFSTRADGVAPAERMRITDGGNVGIGTTTPNGKLSIVGANAPTDTGEPTYKGTLRLIDSGGVAGSTDGGIEFKSAGTGSGYGFRLTAANPGTGEVPFSIQRRSNSASWVDAFTVLATSGNVGIATTSPWRSLAVTGTVGFDGLTAGAGAGSLCLSANKEVTYSAGATCTVSSGRFKYDIFTASTGLEFVNKLRPVTFKYNSDIGVPGEQFGFIAEEVEALDPRLVVHDAEGLPFSVRYENLTAVLARAIQELSSQISSIGTWFVGGKFHVQNDVCVDDVCINKEQFKQMLLGASGAASSALEPLVLTPPTEDVATTSDEVPGEGEVVPPPVEEPPQGEVIEGLTEI